MRYFFAVRRNNRDRTIENCIANPILVPGRAITKIVLSLAVCSGKLIYIVRIPPNWNDP